MSTPLSTLMTWSTQYGAWSGNIEFLAAAVEDMAAGKPARFDVGSLEAARLLPEYVALAQWRHTAYTRQVAKALLDVPEDYAITRTAMPRDGLLTRWADVAPGQEPPRPAPAMAGCRPARVGQQLLAWADGVRMWHDWIDAGDAPLIVHDLRTTMLGIWLTITVPTHQRTFVRLATAASHVADNAGQQRFSLFGGPR